MNEIAKNALTAAEIRRETERGFLTHDMVFQLCDIVEAQVKKDRAIRKELEKLLRKLGGEQ